MLLSKTVRGGGVPRHAAEYMTRTSSGRTVRAVFLLGRVANKSLQTALELEHGLYKDTVQGDFLDSYQNLSHKGVLGFRWISQYCAGARHVVKIDDDVFFDTFKALHRYRGIFQGHPGRAIFCNAQPRDTMPIYRKDSRWVVEEKQFQGERTFPYHYCSGMAVVLNGDLVRSLYQAAFFTPVFWIDDIYLFGMLPAVAGNVTVLDLGFMGKYITLDVDSALRCMREQQYLCSVLATVSYDVVDWEVMWNITTHLHLETGWRIPFLRVE